MKQKRIVLVIRDKKSRSLVRIIGTTPDREQLWRDRFKADHNGNVSGYTFHRTIPKTKL